VYVAEGDRVAAGEAVAEFDQAMLERSVRAAAVAVERAEARLVATERRTGRRQQLFALASDARGVPATDTIEGEVQAAEIRFARVVLAGAEARRAAGVLRARADGIVDRRYLAEGDVAASGEPVVRIIELSSVVVRAAVPRALLPLVKAGGAAEVRSGAGRSPGTIRRVDTTVDAADGAVPFEVRAENAGFALRPGAVVEVGVEVPYDEAEFSIPLGSVQRGIEARPFTFVVVKIGGSERIARRPITLGGLRGDRASVVAGLAVGDRVVSFGQDLVTVGDPVTVVGEGP
jgi:RND family efflux transporter MFP subunit